MHHLRDRRWLYGSAEGVSAERRIRTRVLALPAVMMAICVCSAGALGANPVSPASIPELLEELAFPRQAALPTCATSVGELPGAAALRTKRELAVGQDDGAIVIFQYDPLNQRTPSFLIPLRPGRRIDDVCSIRVLEHSTGHEGILTIALQGTTATLVSHESMKPVAEVSLPEPFGHYSLGVVRSSQTAYAYDARSLRELVVRRRGSSWSLSVKALIDGQPGGFRIAVLPDRLLAIGDSNITEVLGPDSVSTMSLPRGCARPMQADAWCATTDLIALGHNETERGYLTLLEKRENGWSTSATVALPGTVDTAAAISDTSVILGGACQAAWGGVIGWLAIVTASGETSAQTQHPVPVAVITRMDDYVVAHGVESNLSVYDEQLRPIWDHASMVGPVAILSRDFDGIGSEDLAVVGIDTQRRRRWEVDSMRVYLKRQDIFEGAQLTGMAHDGTGGYYVKRQGSATLFLSNRHVLRRALEEGREAALRQLAAGEAQEALKSTVEARGAAAALGDRDSVSELTSTIARCASLPGRTRKALVAAVALLVLGAYAGIRRWQGAHRIEVSALWTIALLLLGGIAWWIIGTTRWSWSLPAGGAVVAAVVLAATVRTRKPYRPVVAGSLIEELIEELAAFIHGGLKDSLTQDQTGSRPDRGDYARKNITKLAYLAQEMLDSLEDRRRYDKLRGMLEDSAAVYRRSVFPRTRILAELGHKTRFMVESLDALAGAASETLAALGVVLGDEAVNDELLKRNLKSIQDSRQRLVNAAEKVRDAVESNPGCSLGSSIADVLSTARESLGVQAVTVEHSLKVARGGDAVRIKRPELFTILENLLTNASKAMGESSTRRVAVTARGSDDACTVVVKDTGRGMSAEEMSEIFVERTDQSTGRFGLPYTRRTLRRYGGEITVTSAIGKGTTFVVSIPRWRPETEEEDREQEG